MAAVYTHLCPVTVGKSWHGFNIVCPDKIHADVPKQDNGPQRPGTKDAERTGSIPHCFEFNIMQALEGRIPGLCTGQ